MESEDRLSWRVRTVYHGEWGPFITESEERFSRRVRTVYHGE